MKRAINVKVLPGQPLDGSGKVCIHLFVQDSSGKFTEPHALHVDENKKLISKPTRGRLACNRSLTVASVIKGGVTTVTLRSDDPRAVTCLKCVDSVEYKNIMKQLATV